MVVADAARSRSARRVTGASGGVRPRGAIHITFSLSFNHPSRSVNLKFRSSPRAANPWRSPDRRTPTHLMGSHRADRSARRHRSDDTPSTGRHRTTVSEPHRGRRRRALPSAPLAGGVLLLAVAVGGVVTGVQPPPSVATSQASAALQAGGISVSDALGGTSGTAQVQKMAEREAAVSRDSRRDAQEAAADEKDLKMAEAQARQRNAALAQFAQQAEQQAKKIA